jgi:hypothetical protein
MYCTSCMKSVGDASFCPSCGKKTVAQLGDIYPHTPIIWYPIKTAVVLCIIAVALMAFGVYQNEPRVELQKTLAGCISLLFIAVPIAFIAGIIEVFKRKAFKRRMNEELDALKPKYRAGDRVRVSSKFAGTAKPEETGHSEEVIMDDVEPILGTVVEERGAIPVIEWDSGHYRVFRELMKIAAGDSFAVDKGRVYLKAFKGGMHTDYIRHA